MAKQNKRPLEEIFGGNRRQTGPTTARPLADIFGKQQDNRQDTVALSPADSGFWTPSDPWEGPEQEREPGRTPNFRGEKKLAFLEQSQRIMDGWQREQAAESMPAPETVGALQTEAVSAPADKTGQRMPVERFDVRGVLNQPAVRSGVLADPQPEGVPAPGDKVLPSGSVLRRSDQDLNDFFREQVAPGIDAVQAEADERAGKALTEQGEARDRRWLEHFNIDPVGDYVAEAVQTEATDRKQRGPARIVEDVLSKIDPGKVKFYIADHLADDPEFAAAADRLRQVVPAAEEVSEQDVKQMLAALSPAQRRQYDKAVAEEQKRIAGEQEAFQKAADAAWKRQAQRFQQGITGQLVEEMARRNMPQTELKALGRIAYNASVPGMLTEWAVGNATGADKALHAQIMQRAMEKYDPSIATRIGGEVAGLLLSGPVFAAGGALGRAGAAGMRRIAERSVMKRLMARGITEGAEGVARRLVARNTAQQLAQAAVASGTTLGTYDAVATPLAMAAAGEGPGFVDVLGAAGRGFATGALLPGIGMATGRVANAATSRLGRYAAEAGGFAAENAAFVGMGTLYDGLRTGEWGSSEQLAEDFGHSVGVLGIMKSVGALKRGRTKNPGFYDKVIAETEFTPEEVDALGRAGVDGRSYKRAVFDLLNAKETAAGREVAERAAEQLGSRYADVMQSPEVPVSAKAKLMYLVEGRIPERLPLTTDVRRTVGEDGRTTVDLLDPAGNLVQRRTFATEKAAEAFERESAGVREVNGIQYYGTLIDRMQSLDEAAQAVAAERGVAVEAVKTGLRDAAEGRPHDRELVRRVAELAGNGNAGGMDIPGLLAGEVARKYALGENGMERALALKEADRTPGQREAVAEYAARLKEIATQELRPEPTPEQRAERQLMEVADRAIEQTKNRDDGVIYTATMQDGRQANIIKGASLVYDPETGEVDAVQSDPTVIVRYEDGEMRQVSVREIDMIEEAVSTDDARAEVLKTIREQLDAAAREQALADAADRGGMVELKDGRIGVVEGMNEDGSFNVAVQDAEGRIVTGQVAAGDIAGPVAEEQVREAAPTSEVAEAEPEVPGVQEQASAAAPEVPRLKNGQPDFNAMPADMLAVELSAVVGHDKAVERLQVARGVNAKNMEKLRKALEGMGDLNKAMAVEQRIAAMQQEDARMAGALEQLGAAEEPAVAETPAGTFTQEIDRLFPDGLPNVRARVLADIARGQRFVWNDSPDGVKRGVATELGFAGNESERRARFGMLGSEATGAKHVSRYVHDLWQDSNGYAFDMDDAALRDEVIDVLLATPSRASAMEQLRDMAARVTEDATAPRDAEDLAAMEAYDAQRNESMKPEPEAPQPGADDVPFSVIGEASVAPAGVTPERWNVIVDQLRRVIGAENVVTDPAAVRAAYDRITGRGMEIRRQQVAEANERFNAQLDLFEGGTLPSDEKLVIGRPCPVLLASGVDGSELYITQSVLRDHMAKHGLSAGDLKNLPEALEHPIMVYEWGSKAKSIVIITAIPRGNERIAVAVRLKTIKDGIKINKIASIHGKSAERLLADMNTPLTDFGAENLKWVDKEKVLDWMSMEAPLASSASDQGLVTAVKIVTNFENPKIGPENINRSIVAYHGSPHDFNKFSTEKIGTGEGRQAFGYGLYFADNGDIAKWYADRLADVDIQLDGKPLADVLDNEEWDPTWQWWKKDILSARNLKELRGKIERTYIDGRIASPQSKRGRKFKQEKMELLRGILSGNMTVKISPRNLYNVEISGDNFLEWNENTRFGLYNRITNGLNAEQKEYVDNYFSVREIDGLTINGIRLVNNGKPYDYSVELDGEAKASVFEWFFANAEPMIRQHAERFGDNLPGKRLSIVRNYVTEELEKARSDNEIARAEILESLLPATEKDVVFEIKKRIDYPLVKDLYEILSTQSVFGSDRAVSEYLKGIGYDGIRYPAQSMGVGDGSDGWNYVVFDPAAIEITDHIRYFRTPEGEVYGFTAGGKIYLDGDRMNAATPMHEYTELWSQIVAREKPELWARGVELMKQTEVWKQVNADPNYKRLPEDLRASETLSRVAAGLFEEKQAGITDDKGLFDRFRDWLREFWNALKATFSKWTQKRLEDLSADDFARMPLRDFVEGIDLKKYNKAMADERTLAGVHNLSEEKLAHAAKIGGLANPSMAVINTDIGVTDSFGEISLIAPRTLIDKKSGDNIGTWAADAYTPRYPRGSIEYSIPEKARNRIWTMFEEAGVPDAAQHILAELEKNGQGWLHGERMLQYLFLKEKGIDVTEKHAPAYDEAVRSRFADLFGTDREAMPELTDEQRRFLTDVRIGEMEETGIDIGKYKEKYADENGLLPTKSLRSTFGLVRADVAGAGQIDEYETGHKAADYIEANGLADEFKDYVDKWYESLGIEEKLFNGYTPAGDRRYLSHTLENVSRMMKREGRAGGENFSGMGAVRATLSPVYKKLEDIRKGKNRIVSHGEFETMKEDLQDEFDELATLTTIGRFDTAADDRLGEAMLKQNPKAYLKQEYDIDITDENERQIKELAYKLSIMPTEYFETKFERPVYLNEFAGAVIPADASAKTKKILDDAGIPYRTYAANEERAEVVRAFSEELGDVRFSMNGEKARIREQAQADGSYLKAPNGKPSRLTADQWETVRTRQFKEWFGDWENDPENASKVVDENGEPMVVHHGSNQDKRFTIFDKKKIGYNDWGLRGKGFYYSPNIRTAEGYAKGSNNVYSVFLNSRNLLDINSFKSKTDLAKTFGIDEDGIQEGGAGYSIESAYVGEFTLRVKEKEFDGIISAKGKNIFEIVVFKPTQIKSATDNTGAFDPANPDIRFNREFTERRVTTLEKLENKRDALVADRGNIANFDERLAAVDAGIEAYMQSDPVAETFGKDGANAAGDAHLQAVEDAVYDMQREMNIPTPTAVVHNAGEFIARLREMGATDEQMAGISLEHCPNGIQWRGEIVIRADVITDKAHARLTYLHEQAHDITEALFTPDELYDAAEEMGVDYMNRRLEKRDAAYHVDGESDASMVNGANEMISRGVELLYGKGVLDEFFAAENGPVYPVIMYLEEHGVPARLKDLIVENLQNIKADQYGTERTRQNIPGGVEGQLYSRLFPAREGDGAADETGGGAGATGHAVPERIGAGTAGAAADAGGRIGGRGGDLDRPKFAFGDSEEAAPKLTKQQQLIADLRRAVRESKAAARSVAQIVSRRVRREVGADLVEIMGKRDFDALIRQIEEATARQEVEKPLQRIAEVVTDLEIKRLQKVVDDFLKLKVQGEGPRGVSVAKEVDDRTRRMFEIFRNNLDRPAAEVAGELREQEDADTLYDLDAVSALEAYQEAVRYGREADEIDREVEALRARNTQLRRERIAANKVGHKVLFEFLKKQILYNNELIDALEAERVETKGHWAGALKETAGLLSGQIGAGREILSEWKEQEQERRKKIVKEAFRDVDDGTKIPVLDKRPGVWTQGYRRTVEFLLSPAYSMDYLLKTISVNAPKGEGALYDHFMRSADGYVEARGRYYLGYEGFKKVLDDKARAVFGKSYPEVVADSNAPTAATITITNAAPRRPEQDKQKETDAGNPEPAAVEEAYNPTIGEALYIYMANKMTDGRVKLKRMGIKEEDVDALAGILPARFVQFAEWLQNEFLPERRKTYNATHLAVFGTQMARIENYVPLKIQKSYVRQEVDGSEPDPETLPSAITGSIIKRTRNNQILNLHTNALDLMLEHGQQMEHWNAFTRIVLDMNALLTSTAFRRMLDTRNPGLHKRLKVAAQLAADTYRPQANDVNRAWIALGKLAASSKIAFRVNTALKQVLSYPAFYAYSPNPKFWTLLTKNLAPTTWAKNFRWCIENIPSFRERWLGRMAGNEKLAQMTAPALDRWLDKMNKYGMVPNAFVDALTCANGAMAVYDFRRAEYMERGRDEAEAERLARIDAAVSINATQQSSEGMYIGQMQADRDFWSVSLSTFQNSNFAYLRKQLEGIDELFRDTMRERKNRTAYYKEQGFSEDEAFDRALKEVTEAKRGALLNIGVFVFGLNILWGLGNNVWKYLFASETRDEIPGELAKSALMAPIRNTTVGSIAESFANGYDANPSVLLSDMVAFTKRLRRIVEKENPDAWNETAAYLALQTISANGLGIDLESFVNMCQGIAGMIRDGVDAEDLMRMLNAPQSQAKLLAGQPREGESAEEYRDRIIFTERRIAGRLNKSRLDKWSRNYIAYRQAEALGLEAVRDKFGSVTIPEMKQLDAEYGSALKQSGLTAAGDMRKDYDWQALTSEQQERWRRRARLVWKIHEQEQQTDTVIVYNESYAQRMRRLLELKKELINGVKTEK